MIFLGGGGKGETQFSPKQMEKTKLIGNKEQTSKGRKITFIK